MSESVKNIAIVGAGGQVGKFIAKELLAAQKFNITAITRADSTSAIPSGIKTVNVDYNDPATLVSALTNIDVLIISLAVTAPRDTQAKLIRAAAEAKVPWILPNEWGSDHLDASLAKESLIGEPILAARRLIEELGVSAWIAPGFAPYCYGFDVAHKKVTQDNEGDTRMCTSTWDLCGKAAVRMLELPVDEREGGGKGPKLTDFKNGFLYIRSSTLTQREMLDSILRVTGDKEGDWTVTKQPAHERYAEGLAMMKDPAKGRLGFGQALYARTFYPDEPGVFEHKGLANDVLGLEKEDLDFCTRRAIEGTA